MDERRQTQRGRTFLGGKIWTHRRRAVITCTVRNISDTGCCRQVESIVGVPPVFDLQIDGENDTRTCAVVWQSDNRVGVAFRETSTGARRVERAAPEPVAAPA